MDSVFQMDSPVLSADEFARRTGIPVKTVIDKIHSGELPRFRTGLKPGAKEKILVNVIALQRMAELQAESFINPVNEG